MTITVMTLHHKNLKGSKNNSTNNMSMVERYYTNPLPFFTWYTYIYSLPVIVVNRDDDSATVNF
jgi:hypothetical protein